MVESITWFGIIKVHHRTITSGKYAAGCDDSLIDDKNSHIHRSLIMFIFNTVRHALLEWQKNKGVHPNCSK